MTKLQILIVEDELIVAAEGKSWFDQFLPEKERKWVKQVFSQMMAGPDKTLRITANILGAALGVPENVQPPAL